MTPATFRGLVDLAQAYGFFTWPAWLAPNGVPPEADNDYIIIGRTEVIDPAIGGKGSRHRHFGRLFGLLMQASHVRFCGSEFKGAQAWNYSACGV